MAQQPSPDEFRELLTSLVRRFGSRDALGKKIGMSGSRVGRAIDGQYAFNITNCLKLAEASGESPSMVLSAAGKHDVATLIERLYGRGRPGVSSTERELLDEWDRLTPSERDGLRVILAGLQPRKPAARQRAAAADSKNERAPKRGHRRLT